MNEITWNDLLLEFAPSIRRLCEAGWPAIETIDAVLVRCEKLVVLDPGERVEARRHIAFLVRRFRPGGRRVENLRAQRGDQAGVARGKAPVDLILDAGT